MTTKAATEIIIQQSNDQKQIEIEKREKKQNTTNHCFPKRKKREIKVKI